MNPKILWLLARFYGYSYVPVPYVPIEFETAKRVSRGDNI